MAASPGPSPSNPPMASPAVTVSSASASPALPSPPPIHRWSSPPSRSRLRAPSSTHAPSTSVMGLYWSSDAGLTWQMATILDGSQTVQTPQPLAGNNGGNAATAVTWNPVRQRFYAAVRFHGYYESADGITWTRLAHQPGAALTTTACPANPGAIGSSACPIFRGALAAQPATGDLFALTVDAQNRDQGLYQDACALTGANCATQTVLFANALPATPLEAGSGNPTLAQADYNLALAAAPSGTDTLLYVGTVDLYRCSLASGCALRNTTNAQNGCLNPAGVFPAQHAIATLPLLNGPLVLLGNDGGIYRSTDGVNEQAAPCSLDDANHFQNLNSGLGSLAEIVDFAQDPTSSATLLAGLGALGSAGTGTVTSSWPTLATGEGGTVAIDPANPSRWYLSTGAGVDIAACANGAGCSAADFTVNAIGATQVAGDPSAIDAPWLLDPANNASMIVGTCRTWRGPVSGGLLWSSSNALSAPFATPAATACANLAPVVRSLAAAGPANTSASSQNAGSEVLYAGLAGALDGGQGSGGHLFVTTTANLATDTTAWRDAATATVTNDLANSGLFNPGAFDISSLLADPHDATGNTVYATVMGFSGNGISAPPRLSFHRRRPALAQHLLQPARRPRQQHRRRPQRRQHPLPRARHRRIRHHIRHKLRRRQLLERLRHFIAQRPGRQARSRRQHPHRRRPHRRAARRNLRPRHLADPAAHRIRARAARHRHRSFHGHLSQPARRHRQRLCNHNDYKYRNRAAPHLQRRHHRRLQRDRHLRRRVHRAERHLRHSGQLRAHRRRNPHRPAYRIRQRLRRPGHRLTRRHRHAPRRHRPHAALVQLPRHQRRRYQRSPEHHHRQHRRLARHAPAAHRQRRLSDRRQRLRHRSPRTRQLHRLARLRTHRRRIAHRRPHPLGHRRHPGRNPQRHRHQPPQPTQSRPSPSAFPPSNSTPPASPNRSPSPTPATSPSPSSPRRSPPATSPSSTPAATPSTRTPPAPSRSPSRRRPSARKPASSPSQTSSAPRRSH